MKKTLYSFAPAVLLVLGAACATRPAPAPAPAPEPAPAPAPAPEPAPAPWSSLHDQVHAALERAPDLDESRISVRVEPGGVVHLGGWVESEDQKQTAHNVAHAVDGVQRVYYDELRVE